MGSLSNADLTRPWALSGRVARASVAAGVAGLVVLALLAGPFVLPAGAHARLLSSTPEADEMLDVAPDAVELRFDEPVEVTDQSILVTGPDGAAVHDGPVETAEGGEMVAVALDHGDAVGTYTVVWRVTSMDTHVLTGTFLFHVGERTGSVPPDDPDDRVVEAVGFLGRWLGFLGSVVAVGAAVLALVGRDPTVRARLRWPVVGGAAVAVVGVGVALVSRVGEITGRSWFDAIGAVRETIDTSRSAELLSWRAGFLVLLLVAAAVGRVWRWSPWPAVAFGAAATVTSSVSGHAWTSSRQTMAVVADVVHFGAVAVWIGGLVALAVTLPVAADAGDWARRFSRVALGAVVVVALTGTTLGWQHLDGFDELTSTGYGRLLSAKLLLFGVLVGFGWLNRARLVDLVSRTIVPLTRSLRAEVAVAVVVLGVTAALVNTPPAGTLADTPDEADGAAADGHFSETVAADPDRSGLGAELALHVMPAQIGDNELHLNFFDDDGEPLEMAIARAEVSSGDMPSRPVDLSLLTPTHAYAHGVALPTPGTWTVQVTALPVQSDDPVVFTFEVPIT